MYHTWNIKLDREMALFKGEASQPTIDSMTQNELKIEVQRIVNVL